MKTIVKTSRVIALTCALFINVGDASVLAQEAAAAANHTLDARGVAALVQSFYNQTTSLEADFHQTQFTKVYNRYDRSKGHMTFKKPGKMRWDYAAPNGQVFMSDGRRLITYQPPEEGETEGQLIDQAVSGNQLPQAFAFLTGTGFLDRDFFLRLLEPRRQGFEGGYVLELRPREASAHYERILFFVRVLEQNGKRAGIIQRVLIIDAQGNRNRFDLKNIRFNTDIPESLFSFEPPPNTRRIHP